MAVVAQSVKMPWNKFVNVGTKVGKISPLFFQKIWALFKNRQETNLTYT